MDFHFKSFGKKVLPVLTKHGIGVLGMKSMGDGVILRSNTVTPVECLHYAMNLPTAVVIAGCDSLQILGQALQAARTFRPLGEKQVAAILAKTAPLAAQGEFEPFNTGCSSFVEENATVCHSERRFHDPPAHHLP